MAGLDEPNFDLFGSFGLEFLEELTEQTETTETGGVATITEQTEQTESGQLNDEVTILLLRTETKTQLKRRKVTLMCFTDGQKLSTKQELLKHKARTRTGQSFGSLFFKCT